MKATFLGTVALFAAVACGGSDDKPAVSASSGGSSSTGGTSGGTGGNGGAGTSTGGSTSTGGTSGGGTGGLMTGTGGVQTAPGLPIVPMPLISRGVPTSASSGVNPTAANDDSTTQSWSATALPAWLAYDLSSKPAAQRQKVLVVWYDYRDAGYFPDTPASPLEGLPLDYTIEINTAPGGGAAPTTGWTVATTVTGNTINTRQAQVDLNGGNWIRLNVTKAGSPTSSVIADMDVYDVSAGITDSWMFMGDSISFMTLQRVSDLPNLVEKGNPAAYPAFANAAVGGTNSADGQKVVQAVLDSTPAKFIVLAYGTNDVVDGFLDRMESLVGTVTAAGRIPVVPRMPWTSITDQQAKAAAKVDQIDQLYEKHPEILKGPDLYGILKDHPELIDVHPNNDGQKVIRDAWAKTILATYK